MKFNFFVSMFGQKMMMVFISFVEDLDDFNLWLHYEVLNTIF